LESPFLHNEDGFARAIPFSFIVTIEIAKTTWMLNVGDNLPVVSEDYREPSVSGVDILQCVNPAH